MEVKTKGWREIAHGAYYGIEPSNDVMKDIFDKDILTIQRIT